MKLTPDRYSDEKKNYTEKIGLRVDLIKNIFSKLKKENCHDIPVPLMPCCQNRQYKKKQRKKGNRFNAESFFLAWLEDEIWYSNFEAEYDTRLLEEWERDSGGPPSIAINKIPNWPIQIKKISHIHKKTSKFIKKYLPNSGIDPNPQRIKSKIWRLEKSGVKEELINNLSRERERLNPKKNENLARQKRSWEELRLAPEVAHIVYGYTKKEIDRRTLMRKHLRNIKKEDLERIQTLLLSNYQIQTRREGYRNKTTVYYVNNKSK